MRIEDIIPAIRSGRRARRRSWPAGDHITVDLIGGVRADHFTIKSGASECTWPGSQRESHDMLADDWELLAIPEYEAYIPGNFREAFDIVLSMMSNEVFEPYDDMRKSRYEKNNKADCDWKEMGKNCMSEYIIAASAVDRDDVKAALARACISSLKALSYHIALRYIEEVMRG